MRNINKVIRCASVDEISWKACINGYLAIYRNTPHSTTNCTPNNMMKLSDDSGLYSINKLGSSKDTINKAKMKLYTDKKRQAKAHSFKVGDIVVHKWNRSSKYQTIFDPDCYKISEINHSMITAKRSDHKVTRNCSFFQAAKLLEKKTKNVIEVPMVKQFPLHKINNFIEPSAPPYRPESPVSWSEQPDAIQEVHGDWQAVHDLAIELAICLNIKKSKDLSWYHKFRLRATSG